jgi:plasmid stability protein
MQYTIRNVPPEVDAALRRRATQLGKSLNEVAREALARGAGVDSTEVAKRDLGDVAGKWPKDAGTERALQDQRRVDEKLWR